MSSPAPSSATRDTATAAGPSYIPASVASSIAPSSRRAQKSPMDQDGPLIEYSSFPTQPPPPRPFPFSQEDTEKSRLAYESLAASAKAYRVALGQLSTVASHFGAALETCARLKEARAQPYPPGPYGLSASTRSLLSGGDGGGGGTIGGDSLNSSSSVSCTADVLLATSGLYYLAANQQGILAETVYRAFELPIVHELDRYRAEVEAEQESYMTSMREASRDIRRLEKEGVKLRKPRQRDVGRMRSHLVAMTAALDGLTARQHEHAVALLDQSRDMSGTASQASRNLVRAEMDILDALARKGWPGGGLDGVLDGAVDLFSGAPADDDDVALAGAVVSSASGAAGSSGSDLGRLGPKLLLLGGGPISTGLSRGHSRSGSDASTVEGQPAGTASSGGKVFSILPSSSILNEDDTDSSEPRGRSQKKQPRVEALPIPDAGAKKEGGGDDLEPHSLTLPHRYGRSDSLSVDARSVDSTGSAYAHQYQSLDSVAAAQAADAEVAGDEKQSTHPRQKSSSTKSGGRSRGRARPFSPQRVTVDPDEDVFTETEPSTGSKMPTAHREATEEPSEGTDTGATDLTDEQTLEEHAWRDST